MSHTYNFFDPNAFHVQFSFDDDKEDIYKYNLKGSSLPEVTFGITTIYKGGKLLYLRGDSVDEGVITLDFILDEELRVYTDLIDLNKDYFSKGKNADTLQIFIFNNQNELVLRFDFKDVFFSYITSPLLDITAKETESYISATMNFKKYSYKRMA